MERDNYSLILEYMPLGSLTEFRKEFRVQFPLFVRIAKEVISALDWLHSRDPQVLHLDLKADNILLDKNICAKVRMLVESVMYCMEIFCYINFVRTVWLFKPLA